MLEKAKRELVEEAASDVEDEMAPVVPGAGNIAANQQPIPSHVVQDVIAHLNYSLLQMETISRQAKRNSTF